MTKHRAYLEVNVAYHEAGHCVASHYLGFPDDTEKVTIVPEEGVSLGHRVPLYGLEYERRPPTPKELKVFKKKGIKPPEMICEYNPQKARNAVIALYAGVEASVRFDPQSAEVSRRGGAMDDQKAHEYLKESGQLDMEEELRAEAGKFLADHWPQVRAIAEELVLHKTLVAPEIAMVLEIANGNTDEIEALARYRRWRRDSTHELPSLFDNLDRWRHLPSYQLERRADVIFSLYLKGALEAALNVRLREQIIPEFPLQKRLLWESDETDQSVKVDFVVFAENLSKVYLVELKTDVGSRREVQDEYLRCGKDVGFRSLVRGVIEIASKSTEHRKYLHLLTALAKLGFLRMPDDIEEFVYPKPRKGLSARLKAIEVAEIDPAVEVVYVLPVADAGVTCVDFERFAQHVEKHTDPISQRFAQSLRHWSEHPAGSVSPRVYAEPEIVTLKVPRNSESNRTQEFLKSLLEE